MREPEERKEIEIALAIVDAYHEKLKRSLKSDVIVAGAGPSGLAAGYKLARYGFKVVLLEKNLAPGGGVWGGSLGMNEVVVPGDATGLLDEVGVRHCAAGRLSTVEAAELASALSLQSLQAGVTYLNLMTD